MAVNDRFNGVNGNVAIKAPCRVATTANITLSGLQTIDGVTVVADDRVLVKNQTTATENGIYEASTSTWKRAKDFNGNRDIVQGTTIPVYGGTVNGGMYYQVTNANPITIGTTSLTFDNALASTAAMLGMYQSGTLQDLLRYVTAFTFGAVGDGISHPLSEYYATLADAQVAFPHAAALTDEIDWAATQKAINTGRLVKLPLAHYIFGLNQAIIGAAKPGLIGEGSLYESGGTIIEYDGTDAPVKIYESGASKRVVGTRVENVGIILNTAGAKGLDFSHAAYSDFKNIFVRMLAATQSGFYASGNTLGSAPYYNSIDSVSVFGQNDGATYPTQRGFHFVSDGSAFVADGPNANNITNVKRISGVDVAFDIKAGNGNLISNAQLEAIRSYAVSIGEVGGAAGQADGNKITGLRIEGDASCVFARFLGAADQNDITYYYTNSISATRFDNQSTGYQNFCRPQGITYVVDFYGSDIPANATTKLSPVFTSNEGSVVVPFNSTPYSMHVTVNRFASGGAGAGVVNFYRTGTVHPDLDFTINDANRFGGRTIQTTPDGSQTYNSFDGTNGFAQVDITTDASWDQTTADVHVQIVFLG